MVCFATVLDVVYHGQLHALAEACAAWILEQPHVSALSPITVIVPGRIAKEQLVRAVADQAGVCSSIAFVSLSDFAENVLTQIVPQAKVATITDVTLTLFELLSDRSQLRGQQLAPLVERLANSPKKPDKSDLMRLALHLSNLFSHWETQEPELIDSWLGAKESSQQRSADSWQAALWQLTRQSLCRLWVPMECQTLGQWWHPTRADFWRNASQIYVPPCALFGFSDLPAGHLQILGVLSQRIPMKLFALSPCREFWDDLQAKPGDAPLLTMWGHAGRMFSRAVNAMSDYNVETAHKAPTGSNLLQTMQRDILDRAQLSVSNGQLRFDGSLSMWKATTIRQELQRVVYQLRAKIASDRTFTLGDAVIYVPPNVLPDYQKHIPLVFEEFSLPVSFPLRSLSEETSVFSAFAMLMELPKTRLSRGDVTPFLFHPSVMPRAMTQERERWSKWIDELGIVDGAKSADHQDTYVDGDLLSWEQGLRRLALGLIMPPGDGAVSQRVGLGGHTYWPYLVSWQKSDSVGALLHLLRGVLQFTEGAQKAHCSLAEWMHRFAESARFFFASNQRQVEDERKGLLEIFRELAQSDASAKPMGFGEIATLLTPRLARASSSAVRPGITVLPLSSDAIRSQRFAWIVGLQSGFPRSEPHDFLDVKTPSAVSRVHLHDKDNLAFLLVFLASSELGLSFLGNHPTTGDELPPSPLLRSLSEVMARYYGQVSHFAAASIPTDNSISPPHRQLANWASTVRSTLHNTSKEALLQSVRSSEMLVQTLALPQVASEETGSEFSSQRQEISLPALRRFLECPLQGWAKHTLGLDEAGEDRELVSAEALDASALVRTMLLRKAMTHSLATPTGDRFAIAMGLYEEEKDFWQAQSKYPLGSLGQANLLADRERMRQWFGQIAQELGTAATQLVSLGQNAGTSPLIKHLPPLVCGEYSLSGTLPIQVGDALCYFFSRDKLTADHIARATVRAYLDTLCSQANGEYVAARSIFLDGSSQTRTLHFAAQSPDSAKRRLGELAQDFVGGVHAYLLPCEVVFEFYKKPQGDFAQLVAKRIDSKSGISTLYGPATNLSSARVPSNWQEIVTRRFGELWTHVAQQVKP